MGARVIQPRNSSDGFKPNNKNKNSQRPCVRRQACKQHFKRSMMSSYLAWTPPTTRNQIWEKQWVGRRKEETWRVLEQLEYSWERGHVHRERLKQAISGPAPLSPRSHTIMHHPHPSLSPLIHLSPPQQGPVVQFPSRPLNSWSHVLHWRMGDVRWVGVSDWAITWRIAEENGCIGCCPLISLVCDCAVVGVCSGCRRMRDEGVNCV